MVSPAAISRGDDARQVMLGAFTGSGLGLAVGEEVCNRDTAIMVTLTTTMTLTVPIPVLVPVTLTLMQGLGLRGTPGCRIGEGH